VVYLDKSLTIRGGYSVTQSGLGREARLGTTTNWGTADPAANPTILDAQGQGRVLCIVGAGAPVIEGLHLTNGNAAGLGGHPFLTSDAGGGVCIYTATATLRGCQITDNEAVSGGGVYLYNSQATLTGNTVSTNTATNAYYEFYGGGGIYLYQSDATLTNNILSGNRADAAHGGGLHGRSSSPLIVGNTIIGNRSYWDGGGVYLSYGAGALIGNTIADNWTTTQYGDGGGVGLHYTDVALNWNIISGNTAVRDGGGLALFGCDDVVLAGNWIFGNQASSGDQYPANHGGGLYLRWSDTTFVNNVIVDNVASNEVAGVYVQRSHPRFLHTTLARNHTDASGDGSAICVAGDGFTSTVALTNTVIVSHTVGITVAAGSTATLGATLWHANGGNWTGAGAVVHTGDVPGDPDPTFAADGYHLTAGSPAVNKGVNAGVWVDIDGQPRPYQVPDLGADEYWPPGVLKYLYLPLVLRGS